MVTLVEVKYQSILPTKIDYLLPVVKIEFSAMSLDEPFENREIATHYTPDLKDIWLCHLSKDNNHPELAYKTIDIRLFREGIRVGKDVNLTALKRTTPSEIFEFDLKKGAFQKKKKIKYLSVLIKICIFTWFNSDTGINVNCRPHTTNNGSGRIIQKSLLSSQSIRLTLYLQQGDG